MSSGRLSTYNALPDGLLECPAAQLGDVLAGPTLFDLSGGRKGTLFLTVLQHGNETSGWDAMRTLLGTGDAPPLMLFVANVDAARQNVRKLPGGVDFNRAWEGGDSPEAAIAEEVTARAMAAEPLAAIDIHNNTGRNPPYSVVTRTDERSLGAAAAFAQRVIVIDHPGVQTRRFSEFCTAVTVEVGTARDPTSADRAKAYLENAFRWREPPRAPAQQLYIYRNLARVLIDGAVTPRDEFEAFNFERAESGTVIADVRDSQGLKAVDEHGADVTARYFRTTNGEVRLRRAVIPSMYTTDLRAARADCLCYLLEPLPGS
ncbi:MAG: succinylglutamate desuccinylase/aspartoacylase family protein [bacterium]|nr:succinylglutamate desuccinylase/aspartoacylase family protein [bacterium]